MEYIWPETHLAVTLGRMRSYRKTEPQESTPTELLEPVVQIHEGFEEPVEAAPANEMTKLVDEIKETVPAPE